MAKIFNRWVLQVIFECEFVNNLWFSDEIFRNKNNYFFFLTIMEKIVMA